MNSINSVPKRDWNALDDDALRVAAIDFIEQNLPPRLRFMKRRALWVEMKDWYLAMAREGWLVTNWPVEYGGMGLTPAKQLIWVEEVERRGAPVGTVQGPMNLGPLLIAHGTEDQRREFLPKILSGEHRWCQGYSEPNAGSDLASLRTEARLEGDEFIINGQKIWTSMAFDSNWMYLLVRTDKTVKKQAGITFLIIDMDQPGVKVRPIRNIMGDFEQCEVFLDNARTPARYMVGKLNEGWTISKSLLGFERIYNGSPKHSVNALTQLERAARLTGRNSDPVFVDRLTQLQLDVLDLGSAYESFAQMVRQGRSFGDEVSLLKVWATETCQRITELLVEVAGDAGGIVGDIPVGGGDETIDCLSPFYEARVLSIYGGSNQIQRNILSKSTLKLPV